MAVIRYNDGYQAVQNIFRSFSQSDPLICTKEAFRLLDNRRIMASKVPSPWQDTFAEEEMDEAKLSRQRAMHGSGVASNTHSTHVRTKNYEALGAEYDSSQQTLVLVAVFFSRLMNRINSSTDDCDECN